MNMKGTSMPKCHKCQEMKAMQGWDDNMSKPRWTVVQDIVQIYLASNHPIFSSEASLVWNYRKGHILSKSHNMPLPNCRCQL